MRSLRTASFVLLISSGCVAPPAPDEFEEREVAAAPLPQLPPRAPRERPDAPGEIPTAPGVPEDDSQGIDWPIAPRVPSRLPNGIVERAAPGDHPFSLEWVAPLPWEFGVFGSVDLLADGRGRVSGAYTEPSHVGDMFLPPYIPFLAEFKETGTTRWFARLDASPTSDPLVPPTFPGRSGDASSAVLLRLDDIVFDDVREPPRRVVQRQGATVGVLAPDGSFRPLATFDTVREWGVLAGSDGADGVVVAALEPDWASPGVPTSADTLAIAHFDSAGTRTGGGVVATQVRWLEHLSTSSDGSLRLLASVGPDALVALPQPGEAGGTTWRPLAPGLVAFELNLRGELVSATTLLPPPTLEEHWTVRAVSPEGEFVVSGALVPEVPVTLGENGPAEVEYRVDPEDFQDAYVARFLADGTLRWARRIGGIRGEWVQAATIAPDGDVFVAYQVTGDEIWLEVEPGFGTWLRAPPGLTSSSLVLARFDASGVLQAAVLETGPELGSWIQPTGLSASKDRLLMIGSVSSSIVLGRGQANETLLDPPTFMPFLASWRW